MTKTAGDFAAQKDTFSVVSESAGPGEDKIVLNISALEEGKSLLAKGKGGRFKLTGNAVIDAWAKMNEYFTEHSKVKVQDLANFFRLLATMINAGVPVVKSLDSLASQSGKSPKMKNVLTDIARKVEDGESLSNALGTHKDVFSEAQVGMISAGEASGQLNEVLIGLATEVEKSASIMRKVKGALTYPVVVFTLMIGVIFIMMTKVVPKLSSLFTQAGSELPALTRGLMASSSFMSNNWLLILLTTFVIVASFTMWKKTKLGRYNWDKAKLRIPIFGNLMRQYILARFSRLFSSLLGSGVPLVNGMQIIARAIGNEVYKERILLSVEDLKQGIPLAENLTGSSHFPEMMVHMIEVGEKTASLEQVTDKLADFYEEQIDVSVKSLTKAFEPIMLITIGGVVGLLVAAIMLPIIQLTEIGAGGM